MKFFKSFYKPSLISYQKIQLLSIKELYFLPLNFILFFKQIRFNKVITLTNL